MNEFKEFQDFISKIFKNEKETLIVIKFNKPQELISEEIRLYLQDIIQTKLCIKSQNNLKTVMSVKSFWLEGESKTIHRRIVKATRRSNI